MEIYKGLQRTLHFVRGAQNYASVIAELLILFAFAMSGLDLSLGGRLAGIPALSVAWGIAFAIGLDMSFILAWVRVRQTFVLKNWKALSWSIPLAVGMSLVIFFPTAVQMLQQSMGLGFGQALTNLGIDLNMLVYSRSAVAVFLGAILAMTNVEGHVTPDVAGVASNVVTLALDVAPVAPDPDIVTFRSETLTSETFPFEQATLTVVPVASLSLPEHAMSQDVASPVAEDVAPVSHVASPPMSVSRSDDSSTQVMPSQNQSVSHLAGIGMTVKEIAELKGVSTRTVQRQLAKERDNAGI